MLQKLWVKYHFGDKNLLFILTTSGVILTTLLTIASNLDGNHTRRAYNDCMGHSNVFESIRFLYEGYDLDKSMVPVTMVLFFYFESSGF